MQNQQRDPHDRITEALRVGDQPNREEFRAFMGCVRKFVCRRLKMGNPDEIVQESMLRLCEAIDGFQGKCTLLTFACAIATNVWHERLRAEKRKCETNNDEYLEVVPATDDPEKEAYRNLIVEDCMKDLSDEERHFLRLRFWGRLSVREVGERLGMSPDDAQAYQKRLLRQMKRHWDKNDG